MQIEINNITIEIINKFHKSKIYKVVDIGYNKCYIGSTCEELSLRMARHRATFKSFLSGDKRVIVRAFDIFNEYGVKKCEIELIEYYKCDTKQELKSQHNGSYFNWRSSISKNARKIFNNSGICKKCIVCGYQNHVDVAHIIPVYEFHDLAKISEINGISNLVEPYSISYVNPLKLNVSQFPSIYSISLGKSACLYMSNTVYLISCVLIIFLYKSPLFAPISKNLPLG